jgi:hypothetical protein
MRTTVRRILAVLIALRGATNFGKPFAMGSGFVVFGQLRGGLFATVVAPLFGLAMLVYAYGLWAARPFARPLGIAYAVWATINVVVFPLVESIPGGIGPMGYLVFAIPGIVGPWLAVWLLGDDAR